MVISQQIYTFIEPIVRVIFLRLNVAFSVIPSLADCGLSLLLLLLFTLIVLPLGFRFNFIKFEILTLSWPKLTRLLVFLFFMPAMGEEIIFRVLLLPNVNLENPSLISMFVWGSISLIAYIVYHPLNALTFYRAGFPTFFNPIFLFSMTLLGVICTISYFKSSSLWLSVIIHWLVVVGWLIFFDGYRMLSKAN